MTLSLVESYSDVKGNRWVEINWINDPLMLATVLRTHWRSSAISSTTLTCSSPSHQPEGFLLRTRMSWLFSRFSCSGPVEEWALSTWAISACTRHKCNLRLQQTAKPGICFLMQESQMLVSLPGFFFPDMLDVWKNTKTSSLQTCRRTKNTEREQKNGKPLQHNAIQHLIVCLYIVESSYISLFRFDVVAGEEACAVAYRAVPPLALSLAHQDRISLSKCQITRLRRLVGVQRHKFWKEKSFKTLSR